MPDRLLIVNGRAGRRDQSELADVVDALRRDGEVEVCRPDGAGELDSALARRTGREVVVAGGDGSLHLVVAALHRRDDLARAVIALLPMGTGNDFARTVGIPLDPLEAANVAVDGSTRAVDLVVDDAGGVVVNAVHLGVGALAGDAATKLKPRLGRLAYAAGAIKAGVRAPGWRVRVSADDAVVVDRRAKVLLVGIGNGVTVGGGTRLAPHARVDDGAVDVIVSRAVGRWARVEFALRTRLGWQERQDSVTMVRARVVRFEGGPIPINTDGEIGDPIASRRWSVEPAAWRLRVPK